jgi:hypothetical protein
MTSSRAITLPFALALAACHYGAVATTGTLYQSHEFDDPWERAARDSAAQDLPCPRDAVRVTAVAEGKYPYSEHRAEGCGKHAVYRCAPASLTQTCEMILVARFDR